MLKVKLYLPDVYVSVEISKVRVARTQHSRGPLTNAPNNFLFFQPPSKSAPQSGNSPGQVIESEFYSLSYRHLTYHVGLACSHFGKMIIGCKNNLSLMIFIFFCFTFRRLYV